MNPAICGGEEAAWDSATPAWCREFEAVLGELASFPLNADTSAKEPPIELRESAVEVLARHPALEEVFKKSGHWQVYSMRLGVPCRSTEALKLRLLDYIVRAVRVFGLAGAVERADELLVRSVSHDLPGYELTFVAGLELSGHWNIASGLAAVPYRMLRKELGRHTGTGYDEHMVREYMGHVPRDSMSVLLNGVRWGPVLVFTEGRKLSDDWPITIKPAIDLSGWLLTSLLSIHLGKPLHMLGVSSSGGWVDEFLDQGGGGGTFFSTPSNLPPPIRVDVAKGAPEIPMDVFHAWGRMNGADRERLGLAAARLSSSLSRQGQLGAQDRVLDVALALELLHALDPGEVTYKMGMRAAWYTGVDADDRLKIRETVTKFYGLRSRIVHGNSSRNTSSDSKSLVDDAFAIARRTLLEHLTMGGVPSPSRWNKLVVGM